MSYDLILLNSSVECKTTDEFTMYYNEYPIIIHTKIEYIDTIIIPDDIISVHYLRTFLN